MLAFKIRLGLAPGYLTESLKNFSSIHHYNTRSSQTDYIVTKNDTATAVMMNSFTYTAKKEWNTLPNGLKSIPNLHTFKSKLREHLFRRY